jgi:hypothetical protein
MAGGDNDGTPRFFCQDAKTDDWCWRCPGAEVDFYTFTGNHFSRRRRKVLGSKAGIIADYQPPTGQSCLFQVVSNALSTGPDIIKGEILGDNRSPAIGTKFNGVTNLPHPLRLPLLKRRGGWFPKRGKPLLNPCLLTQRLFPQNIGFIGLFPREVKVIPPEMPVGSGRSIDRST